MSAATSAALQRRCHAAQLWMTHRYPYLAALSGSQQQGAPCSCKDTATAAAQPPAECQARGPSASGVKAPEALQQSIHEAITLQYNRLRRKGGVSNVSNTPRDVTSAEQSFSQEMQMASWHVRYIPVCRGCSLRCLTRQTVRRVNPPEWPEQLKSLPRPVSLGRDQAVQCNVAS